MKLTLSPAPSAISRRCLVAWLKMEDMMRLVSNLALGAALGLVAFAMPAMAQRRAPAAAPAAPAGPKLGKVFADAYNVAVAAAKANDITGAKAAYATLVATNDDERYFMGDLGIRLGAASNDNAMIVSAADMVLSSAFTKPEDKPRFTFVKGSALADRAQGIQLMLQGYEAGYKEEDAERVLAGAYYRAGDVANGDSWIKRVIDREIAAGKTPVEFYAAAMSENYKAKNVVGALAWSKLLAGASLVPNHWNIIINIALSRTGGGQQADLDLFRLLRKVNALRSASDYERYVQAAGSTRLPGEVTSVIADGKASGVLKGAEPYLIESNTLAASRIAADKASLVNIDKEAAAAADGRAASGGADAMLGYGDYARATALYQIALSKGGSIDANRVNTRLGISRLGTGDVAGAEQAFKSVASGPWKMVADYWLIYLQAKAKNVPTAIPSAAS
jgi:hypothetical protein